MLLPNLLVLTLTSCKLIIHLDAKKCPKGYSSPDEACVPCRDGSYQPEEQSDSRTCRPCSKCNTEKGSLFREKCTKVSNAQCQCSEGFQAWEPDSTSCKCERGSGLRNGDRECHKCELGYFTDKINSECKQWTQCPNGVRLNGTSTKDVVCEEASGGGVTKNIITELISLRPRPETQSRAPQTKTTGSTVSPQPKGTTTNREDGVSFSNSNYIGLALLIFGIVGLLTLTGVTCKMHITPCLKSRTHVIKNDSCRRPVEESGDGSMSSLKLNAEEP